MKLTDRQLRILEAAAAGKVHKPYPHFYYSFTLERRPSLAEMEALKALKLITERADPDRGTGRNTETMEITSVHYRVIVSDLGLSVLALFPPRKIERQHL